MSKVQFEQIEAQYVAMKRQLDQVQENTAIKAPFAGVITDKTAEEGEIYSPKPLPGRSTGLLQLTQLDPLKIDLDLDELTVAHLKKGMAVTFRCDALPDTTFTGTVQFINPSANPLSRTFAARVSVPNRAQVLKAGYFASLGIVIETKKNVLAVPVQAIVDNRVFVVDGGVAVSHAVKTGYRTNEFVEILDGIEEGDRVVVSGNKALPDTSAVESVQ